MELKYSRKFIRQLTQYRQDKNLAHVLARKIKHIEKVSVAAEINELVQIRKTSTHYRIKIKISEKSVYRIGIKILNNRVWFACIEKDKKRFYKQFP